MIAALIPGARLEILDGVGHLFFWERPERSAELVRAHAAGARLTPARAPRPQPVGRPREIERRAASGGVSSGERRRRGPRGRAAARPHRHAAATW